MGALSAAPGADGAPKRGPVSVTVKTKSQAALFSKRKLKVKLRSSAGGKLRLSARQGRAKGLVKKRSLRFKRAGRKSASLKLTAKGRRKLGACGSQRVVVEARYALAGKRRGKVKDKRKLSRDPVRCVENLDRCDPIDSAHCLLPYPNDYFTVPDASTPSGRRLDLEAESMPTNIDGVPSFDPVINRNDGFSPNNVILARVPGIETPPDFKANRLVAQMDIGAYADPDQRLVLINAETGRRHPIWAELDMIPGTPNPHAGGTVQGTEQDRLLMIHPAVALDYGTRYIVALRDLRGPDDQRLRSNPVFEAYRKRRRTGIEGIEARRPHMEQLFSELASAGIARKSLFLAWDFTVASQRNLTERLIAMRDDAFAQLGDDSLTDGAVAGVPPEITIEDEIPYALCDSDSTPDECELTASPPQSDYAFKKVTGTIEVPCYMDAPGTQYNPSDPNTPCASGSRLHFEPGAELPSQNGSVTWDAPFTCIVPRAGNESPMIAGPKPGIVFGHGLLQSNRVVEQLGLFPGSLEGVACGTDWIGLSAVDPITGIPLPDGDLLGHLATMIAVRKDLSLFAALPDRSQQGFVNTLYLARAMAHPDGLAAEPEFQDGAVRLLDTGADLGYYGVSLGGIFGGATTAVAPDWGRAVLSVPGIGFTTLLTRSTQFNQFLPLVYDAYPDPLARAVGLSVLQLLWDRGEPSSYVHGMLDGRFGTPRHQVMIHEAFGDHQVANVQTETLARTLGATVRTPGLGPGRAASRGYLFTDTVEPFYVPGQELLGSAAFNVPGGLPGAEAVTYTLDTGPIRSEAGQIVGTNPNPDWNIAPVGRAGGQANDGLDPHEPSATSPAAQQLAIPFLLGQGIYDSCVDGAPPPTQMPPWAVPYAGNPLPCAAPPVHSPGQGD